MGPLNEKGKLKNIYIKLGDKLLNLINSNEKCMYI